MADTVRLAGQPVAFLEDSVEKTERIVRDRLRALGEEPYPRPGAEIGERERITVDGRAVIRYHIGRSFTAFYTVHETDEEGRVREIWPIDEAHKRYD